MEVRHGGQSREVSETLERFEEEVAAGRAVLHPECPNCGLPGDPEETVDGMHYGCWLEGAGVRERCVAESERHNRLASEALRADAPAEEHLLDVVGDPARPLHDRNDAQVLLSGAVPTRELLDALAECPECGEGEVFPMDPATGEVTCHCGVVMREADA